MITEEEAVERVLGMVGRGPGENVALAEAEGRWLAEAVVATVALPGFDNSAMDGYAVHADDCGQTDRWLDVIGEMAAGRMPVEGSVLVAPGRAVRIFTGACLPPGTGAVVMQEDVEVRATTIRLTDAAAPGDFIRRRGADVCDGQKLLGVGDRLTPARIGLLASQGRDVARVTARPRLVVLTTGDEVVAAGVPLPQAAALYNSNGPMLTALARRCGAVATVAHVPDDLSTLTAALAAALERNDMVVLAGGVSVGRHDYVKPALAALGWKPELWRVAVKPGKPFLCAARDGKCVFGLPGNPVSAFVTFHLFVAPALRQWQGASAAEWAPSSVPATLATAVANHGDRPHYLRGMLGEGGRFEPAGLQESHALFGLSRATALLRVPAATSWEAGRSVSVLPL
jgi:molybdopterin molybdotransferase